MDRLETLFHQQVSLTLLDDDLAEPTPHHLRGDEIAHPGLRERGKHEIREFAAGPRDRRDDRSPRLAAGGVHKLLQIFREAVMPLSGGLRGDL